MSQRILLNTILTGEGLRMELLTSLRMASAAEQGSVYTALILFYGQAFTVMQNAVLEVPAKTSADVAWQAKIHHACARGRAAFSAWRQQETSFRAPADFERLTLRWEALTNLILDQGE